MGPDAMILVFWMVSFKSAFSLSSFTLIKRFFKKKKRGSFVPLHFLPLEIICISEVVDISSSNLDSSLWSIQAGISHDVLCI